MCLMIERIDHLGLAVRSIAEALKHYEGTLGLKCEHIEEVASQKVRTAFLRVGDTHLELLEPTAPDSPVAKFLEKHGEGVHHVAFRTNDVVDQLKTAAATGCQLIHSTPFEGAGGKLVAFLHPKFTYGVLTEFCAPKA